MREGAPDAAEPDAEPVPLASEVSALCPAEAEDDDFEPVGSVPYAARIFPLELRISKVSDGTSLLRSDSETHSSTALDASTRLCFAAGPACEGEPDRGPAPSPVAMLCKDPSPSTPGDELLGQRRSSACWWAVRLSVVAEPGAREGAACVCLAIVSASTTNS